MGRNDRNPRKRKSNTVIVVIILALLALSLVGLLGGLGNAIKNFFTGAFGFMSYAVLAILLLVTVVKGFHLVRRKGMGRLVAFLIALSFIILCYLQVITSFKLYSAITEPDFSSYLSVCYDAKLTTAGGLVMGVFTYPLLSLMGKYSAILLAVLFFIVLFLALFPFMRITKDEAQRNNEMKEKKPAKVKGKKAKRTEAPLRMFVDKVRRGEKDAKTVKRRGLFTKPVESYSPFDVYDVSSILRSEKAIPEQKPEHYNPFKETSERKPEYDEYDEDFARNYSDSFRAPVVPVDNLPKQDYAPGANGELPLFVERHAGERAQAAKKIFGDDGKFLPDEPTYGSEPKKESKPTIKPTPLADLPKKNRNVSSVDIIENLSDLKRVNEKRATNTTTPLFLGETERPKADKPIEPPIDFGKGEEDRFAPIEEKKPSFQDIPPAVKPVWEEEEPQEPEPPVQPKSEPIITPREASTMKPLEARNYVPPKPIQDTPAYSPFAPERSASSLDNIPADEVQPIRQRKPRSDIGGTHRTESNSYIPPKQTEQVEISEVMEEPPARPYTAPPVSFLPEFPPIKDGDDVTEMSETLVQALASFNISSEVVDHKTGPTFTQYAITLPDNMSVNKLMPLDKDIKRKLRIEKDIRIIPSVPGLDAVGIEVPNKTPSIVGLRSLINSPDFEKPDKLYFVIGVDVSGRAVYGDLLKMPHLLVAGSTGSGKSVCLNVLICSILYHYPPEFVRFIMIDPKKVELTVYRNMPHMLIPSTITDMDKAVNALAWAVAEMERRYDLLGKYNCRSVAEYNAIAKEKGEKPLYYIVFIVDELANLMTMAKRDAEEKLDLLTSKARAAGIHLVLATQRPSVDVVTGTIKNNIPTRITFRVTSQTDSRTILDQGGAEALFGHGDMLYRPGEGGGEPLRLQGPFLDNEILKIVDYIKEKNDCRFDASAEKFIMAEKQPEQDASQLPENKSEDDDEDEVFADALLFVIDSGMASISKLQRRFRLGYSRAARIVDVMEARGYVSKADSMNRPRSVLITKEEYYDIYGEDGIEGDESR